MGKDGGKVNAVTGGVHVVLGVLIVTGLVALQKLAFGKLPAERRRQ